MSIDKLTNVVAGGPHVTAHNSERTAINDLIDAFDQIKLDMEDKGKVWTDATLWPYNADLTGATDSRQAIQNAVDDVAEKGGGTVFAPGGSYRVNYTDNAGATGCAGGIQLHDSVTLRGEGVATQLFTTGSWPTQGGIISIGDATTTRAVRDASVRELWVKGTAGRNHATASDNVVGILLNTNDITEEPDAAHRLLDLTVWDCDRGIAVYGVDDRAVIGQRIRLRHFLRQALLLGKETGGGGADGYWTDVDASSGNRLPGGTHANIEIRASNVHMSNSKSWYTKRDTAFVESGDYIDGAGFALLAPRSTLSACEAQDNGGHGFVVRVGQQILHGITADSNNRSDCISGDALPYECSGVYIGSSASTVSVHGQSFDKRSDLAERFQKHGFAVSSSARNIEIRGLAQNNRSSSTSATPLDGLAWTGTGVAHDSHDILVMSTYESERAVIQKSNAGAGVFVPMTDTRVATQPARRIELDFPLATTNPNLEEVRDERDEIVSWMNEAGQYRFRNPYSTWADSGVRGIIEPGDYVGTANGGGNFMELVDRNIPDGPARKKWGVRWASGKIVRNGVEVPDLVIRGAASDPIASTTPANSIVLTLDGERGTGGTVAHTWDGGALPTVVGSVVVNNSIGIVNADSLEIVNDAAAASARFALASPASELAFRFYLRTPSAWPASACTLAGLRPTPSTLSASITLTGTSSPGRLRLTTVGGTMVAETPANTLALSSNYRVELRYNASTSSAYLNLFDMGENVSKFSSGQKVDANFALPVERIDIGRLNATPAVNPFYFDGVQIVTGATRIIGRHDGDTLSPTAAPTPPYVGALGLWDGTKLWPLVNHT